MTAPDMGGLRNRNSHIGTALQLLAGLTAAALLLFAVTHFASPKDDRSVVRTMAAPSRPAPPIPFVPRARPTVVTLAPTVPSAAITLDKSVEKLGKGFAGDVGIAIRDIQTGWTSHYRGLDYFPQQSVSKLWVAISLLDQVDRGTVRLDREITLRGEDMTLFHQPVRALALRPGGFHTTTEDLLFRALTQSDNSANDRLLRQIGGPDIIRATLLQKGVAGVRFGPGEALLQSRIAGMDWHPDYRVGSRFAEARAALPHASRRAAFDAYLADPVDGATPMGITEALSRLKQGKLVSAVSTDKLLSIMSQTRTGAQRLKGGLHEGWSLSHKTGTGQVLDGEQAGYNDVGILTSPKGDAYAIAVMIGRTSRPLAERMKLMQRAVEATIAYDAQLATQRATADLPSPSVVSGS